MATSEEEIIRHRLLFDGEGTGDDRRIQTLLKTIVKWCHTDATQEESNLSYQRIIALLNQCEYAMVKNHIVYEMNNKERKNYEVRYDKKIIYLKSTGAVALKMLNSLHGGPDIALGSVSF